MIEKYLKIFKRLDYLMLITLFLLLAISILVIESATLHLQNDLAFKQATWIGIGIVFLLFFLRYDYQNLQKYTWQIYAFMLVGLFLVPIFAPEINGQRSWIVIPGFGSLQFSEICKILYIITFAKFLEDRKDFLERFRDFIPHFLFLIPILFLIMLQPDFGNALVFIPIMAGMLLAAGANKIILFSIFGGGVVFVVGWLLAHIHLGLWFPIKGYQLNRILVVIDSSYDIRGAGWNQLQSKIAIGNGGLWGKGFREGTQSMGEFLPEQWTDFIFAVLAEELGFIGGASVIILLMIIVFRGLKMAMLSRDFYGSLIAVGVISMYLFHIFENIGMSMGIMPITGIPLPFVSYGGSAMLTNLMGVALLQNIFINREREIF